MCEDYFIHLSLSINHLSVYFTLSFSTHKHILKYKHDIYSGFWSKKLERYSNSVHHSTYFIMIKSLKSPALLKQIHKTTTILFLVQIYDSFFQEFL